MSRSVGGDENLKNEMKIDLGNSILSQEPSGPKMKTTIPVRIFLDENFLVEFFV